MTDSDLAFASIEQIGRLFRKRKLSPVELTRFMLARIEQLNAKLNAYLTVTAELALAQAKKAEAELFAPRGGKSRRDRGPLHGIPISLKDNIYTKDVRTTAGSNALAPWRVPRVMLPLCSMRFSCGGKKSSLCGGRPNLPPAKDFVLVYRRRFFLRCFPRMSRAHSRKGSESSESKERLSNLYPSLSWRKPRMRETKSPGPKPRIATSRLDGIPRALKTTEKTS